MMKDISTTLTKSLLEKGITQGTVEKKKKKLNEEMETAKNL